MIHRLKEDRSTAPRHDRSPTGLGSLARLAFATALVVTLVAGPWQSVRGQAPDPSKTFKVTVVDPVGMSQRVIVPWNRSVTVETGVEVSRVDSIASHIADVQIINPKRILVTGKSYGTTTIVLMGGDGKQYILETSVELDLMRLNEALKAVDPMGDAKAESVLGNILLTGTVSSGERALRMMELASLFLPPSTDKQRVSTLQNHLVVAGEQQVLLRCVVAEVSRAAVREMGVNGFLAGENVRDAFLINQLGGINPINIGAAADFPVTETIPFLTGPTGIPNSKVPTLTLGFPRVQMQLFIKAMADNSLLSVLAEPNLVAISGETASFLAGGEFPVPVPQGNQQVTVEYREFGVRLNFTPIVKGHQRIRLRVAPEVSELDFTTAIQIQGLNVPGLKSRSAETTVDMGNGQTIAIAGLLSEQVRGLASRIPGVGDIPVIGALFRSVNFNRSMTELVILVTPEIVSPLEANQVVRLPNADRRDPSDFQLYALGLLEGNLPEVAKEDSRSGITNDVGSANLLNTEPDELSIHGPWGHTDLLDSQ